MEIDQMDTVTMMCIISYDGLMCVYSEGLQKASFWMRLMTSEQIF